MLGGEIFVPKIPSYKVTDVATAIAPDATQQVVGIRPGEKLHEQMITKGDHYMTVEYPDFFVVLPSTKNSVEIEEFCERTQGVLVNKGPSTKAFSYSSHTNSRFLSVEEIRTLIKHNQSV